MRSGGGADWLAVHWSLLASGRPTSGGDDYGSCSTRDRRGDRATGAVQDDSDCEFSRVSRDR